MLMGLWGLLSTHWKPQAPTDTGWNIEQRKTSKKKQTPTEARHVTPPSRQRSLFHPKPPNLETDSENGLTHRCVLWRI